MAKVTPKATRSNSISEVQNLLDSTKTEILSELRAIKDTLISLDLKIKNVEVTLTQVLDTQRRHDLEIHRLDDVLKSEVLCLKEEQRNMVAELEERNRRRTNLILSNLPEKTDGSAEERKEWDAAKVQSLLESLTHFNRSAILYAHRIGKMNSVKPRLLRVVCRDLDTKSTILRKAKDLRTMPEFRSVFVNHDLTPIQQKEEKSLREELKLRKSSGENVVIRRGKIVHVNENRRNFS